MAAQPRYKARRSTRVHSTPGLEREEEDTAFAYSEEQGKSLLEMLHNPVNDEEALARTSAQKVPDKDLILDPGWATNHDWEKAELFKLGKASNPPPPPPPPRPGRPRAEGTDEERRVHGLAKGKQDSQNFRDREKKADAALASEYAKAKGQIQHPEGTVQYQAALAQIESDLIADALESEVTAECAAGRKFAKNHPREVLRLPS